MYEITCLDLDGNSIDHLTQWDVDQQLVIVVHGCDDDYLSIAPNVHFSNSKRKDEALVVRSTVTNKDTITVDIPNILLQEPYPLLVYVYLTDSDKVTSKKSPQKTILSTEIPIRKRAKPSKYSYVENIERITAKQLKKEIKQEIVDEINQADISFENLYLIDNVLNRIYQVYMSDDKICYTRVNTEEVPLRSITFKDRKTGSKNSISISSNKMVLTVDVD